MKRHIYLIGFMGTGKSTVSKELHKKLRWTEYDMDQWIEQEQKMQIKDIFEQFGEAFFRALETKCLQDLAQTDASIISCGGGTVLREENVDIMRKSGAIVLLTASPETVFNRVKNSSNRPILNGNMSVSYIEQLMERRQDAYAKASDFSVSTDGKTPIEIADEICRILDV